MRFICIAEGSFYTPGTVIDGEWDETGVCILKKVVSTEFSEETMVLWGFSYMPLSETLALESHDVFEGL